MRIARKIRCCTMTFLSFVVFISNVGPVCAIPRFKLEFQKRYISDGPEELQSNFGALKSKCLVCHAKKANGRFDKKTRNEFGQHLDDRIEGDANKRWKNKEERPEILQELSKAFADVEQLETKDGKITFGERMKNGKLPVDVEQ